MKHNYVNETNTYPSGQKSMLLHSHVEEKGGYKKMPARIFKSLMLDKCDPSFISCWIMCFL